MIWDPDANLIANKWESSGRREGLSESVDGANIFQASPSPSAVSGSCLESERDEWKAPQIRKAASCLWNVLWPSQRKATFQSATHQPCPQHTALVGHSAPPKWVSVSDSSYLHGAYKEQWIGCPYESRLQWVHASSLGHCYQQFLKTSLDTVHKHIFFQVYVFVSQGSLLRENS